MDYECPPNSYHSAPLPFFIGDCECEYGYVKHGSKCITTPYPFWVKWCSVCIAIPILYWLYTKPPLTRALVWCVFK
jgi:hypothetical protein